MPATRSVITQAIPAAVMATPSQAHGPRDSPRKISEMTAVRGGDSTISSSSPPGADNAQGTKISRVPQPDTNAAADEEKKAGF